MGTNTDIEPKATKTGNGLGNRFWKGFAKIVLTIVFVVAWLYVIVKLFVFDIDQYVVGKYFPECLWLLNFKFFIFIGIIAIVWLQLGTTKFINLLFYGLFYPLIVFFWKIPYFIFKQRSWNLAFAFVNSIISFFLSFKRNFMFSVVYLISTAIILFGTDFKILGIASGLLLVIVFVAYFYNFVSVFKPSKIFKTYIKIFGWIRENQASSFKLDENIRTLPVASLDSVQLQKRVNNLQMSVLFNRICLFTGRKLRDYQNSGLDIVSNSLLILFLVILTVFSFAFINFGIFKINSDNYHFSSPPNFFIFFYYSFNNLFYASIPQLTPSLPISQMISMVESLLALVLVVIFVSMLISVRSRRLSEDLSEVIEVIESEGNVMETFIRKEYCLSTIDDAIAELEKSKSSFLKFIFTLSASIRGD